MCVFQLCFTENDFDIDDEYVVIVEALAGMLTGTATVGSFGLVLEDANRNFELLGVSAGDVVENITDGSRGMMELVDDDAITVGDAHDNLIAVLRDIHRGRALQH